MSVLESINEYNNDENLDISCIHYLKNIEKDKLIKQPNNDFINLKNY